MSFIDEQPARWGGVFAEGDSLVITYVGQTREEAVRAVQERGKVPGPVRVLVKGGVAPATRHDDWLCEAEAAKAWDASGVGPRRRQRG